ncbi:putative transcription factor C3H family [Helianthus annuus]|uniref:Putative zinc finger, CCCH-type n=1 Tax=Helianthus annuus TaxID=4232 RepID=A0A251TV68_HELAN|nr:putative transcription factor C3H family [Helianthus annuus]KAJ0525961.1 putative transcription factor C3H family [Helianthus annuus]KAJ0534245.1 putative transcription factor C3H family [Helianthus annuus]KAJ0542356.1 putative transcription factor C3H family [Helianthus annuus]KAJ0707399.1 putative transcription factor C3H family [Helianthus annuus]
MVCSKLYYLFDQGNMVCSFYMRTGMCGYGVTCRFHHPDPIMIFTHGPMSNRKEAVNSTQSYLSLPLVIIDNFPFVPQNRVLSGYIDIYNDTYSLVTFSLKFFHMLVVLSYVDIYNCFMI